MADLPLRSALPAAVPTPLAEQTVRKAAALSIDDAVRVSRQCFRQAVGANDPEQTLRCVIFDNAVVMLATRDAYRDGVPPYFRMQWTRARHIDALAQWASDPNPALARLSALTLRLLLRDIQQGPTPPAAELIAATEAAGPKVPVDLTPIPETGQDQTTASQLTENKLGLATQGD